MQYMISIAKWFLNVIYFFMKRLPVRNKVVMISRQDNEPSLDFKLLKYHLKKQDPEVEVVVLCHTLDDKLNASKKNLIRYGFHMLRQMYHIATSKVVVLDSYCIVISLLHHRPGLQIIQIWHSMGSMKKFGYTALDTPEGVPSSSAHLLRMHKNYTCVLASSPAYVDALAAGFQCDPAIVKILPLPRTDLLRNTHYKKRKRKEIYRYYPELEEKKVILYCPTFRKDEDALVKATVDLIKALDHEDEILVMNPHPLSKIFISTPNAICGTPFSSFDLLFIADAFISDYSCMVYEAAFMGIPVYFYNFDMDQYFHTRGLAIDYEKEIPVPAQQDPKKLAETIHKGNYDYDRLQEFADKYIQYDGHAGRDLANYILSFLQE